MKISLALKGRTFTEEHRRKLGRKNEKNVSWKGDNVGYKGLHKWVRKHLPKPEQCQECNKIESYLDLANITGIYGRDFINWKYLCRSCHIKSDGRIYNLRNQKK